MISLTFLLSQKDSLEFGQKFGTAFTKGVCLKRLFMLGFETELLCPATHCSWTGSVAFRANWVTPHSGITTSEQRHTYWEQSLSLSASSRCTVSKAMGLWLPGSTLFLVKWCMRPYNICLCVYVCVCWCLSGGKIQEKVNQRKGEDSEETWSVYRKSCNSNRIPNVGILVIGTSNNALLNKACASTAETTDDIHPVSRIQDILMNK